MASVLQKATPPRELDFDLSLSDLSPTASDRQFMRRSQSFSAMAYGPTQQYQEYQPPQQKQTEPTGFPTPVTPTRSHQGLGAMGLHTPSGTTMPSDHMDAVARSDSKYSSQTVASRTSDQRRARQQRRKTDGSDEILSVRRPSTSHASSPPRKVAYSQYPDFENITDPFAKRDKIPQKSERPFLLDVVAAPAAVSSAASEPEAMPKAAGGENERGGAGEEKLFAAPQAPVRSHSQQHTNIGDDAPRSTTKQSGQAMAAFPEASSGDPSPESLVDAQAKVPTPLRTRDKIPRRSMQPEPAQEPSSPQLADEPLSTPQRKESLGSSPTKLPVTPTKPRAATGSSTSRSMGRSLLISSLVSPVSPIHPAGTGSRLRVPVNGNMSRAPPSLHPADSEASVLSTPVRPFSGHVSSPRLQIDMDKVETLYERRSVIFEKNKSRARERSDSAASSPLGSLARSPLSTTGAGLPAMVEEAEDAKDGEEADEHEHEHEHEHFIPFDQVLIPTAFKRLRAALEDPSFEIDEETYRRFKLSERWYSREEQMQMERAFTQGTFGESKKRSRIIQKRLSELSADPSALGSGPAAVGDVPESYRGKSELPTPPASAMSLDNQHRQRLESLQEEETMEQQEPNVAAKAAPERRRTRSSRKPSHRTHRQHQYADSSAFGHRQVPLPGEYVPPQSMDPAYATPPKTHMQSADYRLQQQQPASDEVIRQDSRQRTSRNQRSTAQPSTSAAEQTAKSSGGCCGCTIM